jgi:REP element-mobilizing transposase RayT
MKKRLYKNKYRVDSLRLPGWDYSSPGFYFITICTKDWANYFGKIRNGKVFFYQLGWITKKYLKQISIHYPDSRIDSFIIMPNHIHLILEIKFRYQEMRNGAPLRGYANQFGTIQSKNVSSIIRSFKSTVKKYANKNNIEFEWQERFYDRIVNDEIGLYSIRQYIRNNPIERVQTKYCH